ncbi:hypothetical protein AB0N81_04155 [Streptomyces sp. NPDC093510]|uniref:hypothetical protein n=1 Tax=Streptomyces sp. NPDC093510 TaxID=3155199 RepID=UPI0034374F5C
MTPTSKRRPVDWQPLCEKLRDQAKNLKAIGDDETLKGKYVKLSRSPVTMCRRVRYD